MVTNQYNHHSLTLADEITTYILLNFHRLAHVEAKLALSAEDSVHATKPRGLPDCNKFGLVWGPTTFSRG